MLSEVHDIHEYDLSLQSPNALKFTPVYHNANYSCMKYFYVLFP